jgi:hypothetical protein
MRTQHSRIEQLRQTIDCMPAQTRVAMLEGVRSNEIIAGAYVDRDGGVCPMLAAHRCGGRTDFRSFARAWDRFTGALRRPRRATQRELTVLVMHLEHSLLGEHNVDLGEAIASHRAALARNERPRPGDRDRSAELRRREGWAWLRPFRRLDDYERALEWLAAEREQLDAERDRDRAADRDRDFERV